MREERTRDLDGLTVVVQQLPAIRAMRLLHRILKAVAPAAAKAMGTDAGAGLGDIAGAAQILFDRLSEADLVEIVKALVEMAWVIEGDDRRPLGVRMDDLLAGRMGTLVKIVGFALEVNYGDFLAVLTAAIARIDQTRTSRSPTTSPLPGPPTA